MTFERTPVACGAIGDYDADRVAAMAERLRAPIVDRGRHSILAGDPPPIRWRSGLTSGWAWGDQTVRRRRRTRSWKDAATELGASGLVLGRGIRFVHSSVSGVGPVYWIEEDGALYFASRIDPLLAAVRGRLSVDWEAWAAILAIDQPIGDRTPFAEIRRLPPMSRVIHDAGRARVSEAAWPWAEVDADPAADDAVADAVAALRSAAGELPAGPVRSLLSGGRDSRLALALLRERPDLEPSAFTVPDVSGHPGELEMAERVADLLQVPLSRRPPPGPERWDLFTERALLVDFQFARQPWLYALRKGLEGGGGPVADGLALDQFLPVWRRGDAAAMSRGRRTSRHLWQIYRRRAIRHVLDPALAEAIVRSARRQYLAEARRFRGHPQQIILAAYRLRTVRGVSTTPAIALGHSLDIWMPFIDHRVVTSLMRVPADAKASGEASAALIRSIDERLVRLPRGTNLPVPTDRAPGHWVPADREREVELLRAGPLASLLRPEVEDGRIPAQHLAGAALFSLWAKRYGERLADLDPGRGFDLAVGRG